MDVDAMQVPVAQSDVPAPQSAPSTLQKSSEKIQDKDGVMDRNAMMMNTRMGWIKMLARPRASQSLSD